MAPYTNVIVVCDGGMYHSKLDSEETGKMAVNESGHRVIYRWVRCKIRGGLTTPCFMVPGYGHNGWNMGTWHFG